MRKVFFALIFIIIMAINGFGQTGPKDLILLLDTSASMSASFQEVRNYVSGAMLKEHLRSGDTFHLIPFSGTAYLDISRRIEGRGELETVIGRMFLQYPLDSWSDIQGALSFAEKYASTLPSRPKKIILVTDGIIALPPGASSGSIDTSGFDKFVADSKIRMNRNNISLEYVKVVPGKSLPKAEAVPDKRPSGGSSPAPSSPPASSSPSSQTPPAAQTPPPVQNKQQEAAKDRHVETQNRAQTNAQDTPPEQTAGQELQQEQNPAASTALIPDDEEQTPDEINVDSDNQEISELTPEKTETGKTPPPPPVVKAKFPAADVNWEGQSLVIIIGLVLIGLILLILIIFFISKELQGKPNRVMAQAASPDRSGASKEAPFTDHSKELASFAASQPKQRTSPYADRRPAAAIVPPTEDNSGPMMMNLFVEDQNTLIGKRNIHSIKSGVSFTLGGGNSDYLIFLVPVPPEIGIIQREGNRYNFIPKKPQYFPDLGSQQLSDCIGKTIRIVSDKNYELRFRFERYVDPLQALNQLLNSVKVPG